jgi:HEAT repeat protein
MWTPWARSVQKLEAAKNSARILRIAKNVPTKDWGSPQGTRWRQALEALGRLRNPSAFEPLRALMNAERTQEWARIEIAETLYQWDPPAVAKEIDELADTLPQPYGLLLAKDVLLLPEIARDEEQEIPEGILKLALSCDSKEARSRAMKRLIAAERSGRRLEWLPKALAEAYAEVVYRSSTDGADLLDKLLLLDYDTMKETLRALHAQMLCSSSSVKAIISKALVKLRYQPESADERYAMLAAEQQWSQIAQSGPAGVSFLVARTEQGTPETRMAIIKAIGESGDRAAIKRLAGLLQDPSLGVRNHAAIALGQVGRGTEDPGAVDGLVRALGRADDEDGMGGVRKFAAEALGELGGRRAQQALGRYRSDSNWHVRKSVIAALARLSPETAIGLGAADLAGLRVTGSDAIEKALQHCHQSQSYATAQEAVQHVARTFREYYDVRVRKEPDRVEVSLDDSITEGADRAPATRGETITILRTEEGYQLAVHSWQDVR